MRHPHVTYFRILQLHWLLCFKAETFKSGEAPEVREQETDDLESLFFCP